LARSTDSTDGGENAGLPGDLEGVLLEPVELNAGEYEAYYEGYSNATIWPLYHDAIRPPVFEHSWWPAYVAVNERFADEVAAVAAPGATVWVQDYHLQLVPSMLRARRPDVRIAFFLHIPFPPPELFRRLPRRREILDGCSAPRRLPDAPTRPASSGRRIHHAMAASAHCQAETSTRRVPVTIDHRPSSGSPPTKVIARSRQIRELGSPEKCSASTASTTRRASLSNGAPESSPPGTVSRARLRQIAVTAQRRRTPTSAPVERPVDAINAKVGDGPTT
jgi:hypothetical protein